jgi:uncharacterized protein
MFKRILNLTNLLQHKSFFLFGARSTGKTTLINEQLKDLKIYDLLDSDVYRRLNKQPKLIEESLNSQSLPIVIDEIQKLPLLLDEVHRLLNKHPKQRFLLTGSSARKLKHGGGNLLAGRAWIANLFPLTWKEITDFNLTTYLNHGGLPQVYNSAFVQEELKSYVGTYLREEIQAEAVTRSVQAFAEFLDIVAQNCGCEINLEKLAADTQVSPSSIKNYLQILDDTLLSFTLKGFTNTKKRKATSRAKFYLFDLGVTNELCGRGWIAPKSELFGKAFEHFLILEIRAYINYNRKDLLLNYWRSTSGFEVDLIINGQLALEFKATELIKERDLKGLRAFKEEQLVKRCLVVSCDEDRRTTNDGIEIWPWGEFLAELWNGKIIY